MLNWFSQFFSVYTCTIAVSRSFEKQRRNSWTECKKKKIREPTAWRQFFFKYTHRFADTRKTTKLQHFLHLNDKQIEEKKEKRKKERLTTKMNVPRNSAMISRRRGASTRIALITLVAMSVGLQKQQSNELIY